MIDNWQTLEYGAWTLVRATTHLATTDNWQTPAALAVVVLTILLFLVKRKSSKSCGGNCECPKPGDPRK